MHGKFNWISNCCISLTLMKYRYSILFFILLCFCVQGFGKKHVIDSLRHALSIEKEDTNKINTLVILGYQLHFTKPDSTISLAREAGVIAAKLGWKKGLAQACATEGLGDYVKGD